MVEALAMSLWPKHLLEGKGEAWFSRGFGLENSSTTWMCIPKESILPEPGNWRGFLKVWNGTGRVFAGEFWEADDEVELEVSFF